MLKYQQSPVAETMDDVRVEACQVKVYRREMHLVKQGVGVIMLRAALKTFVTLNFCYKAVDRSESHNM